MAFLSVCLSVCQTRALWQNELIVCQYINTYNTTKDSSNFLRSKFRGPPEFSVSFPATVLKTATELHSVESANLTNNPH